MEILALFELYFL